MYYSDILTDVAGISFAEKLTIIILCTVIGILLLANVLMVYGLHKLNNDVKVRAALRARRAGTPVSSPDSEIKTVVSPEGEEKSYDFSFEARLNQSEELARTYYSKIVDALLSYSDVCGYISWECETFAAKGKFIAVVGMKNGVLYVNLPVCRGAYNPQDLSAYDRYRHLPYRYAAENQAMLEQILEMIAQTAEEKGLCRGAARNFSYSEPRKSLAMLEILGLIK